MSSLKAIFFAASFEPQRVQWEAPRSAQAQPLQPCHGQTKYLPRAMPLPSGALVLSRKGVVQEGPSGWARGPRTVVDGSL
eukprot:5696672-Pyramimonas_sp.AAC.1